MRWLLSLVLVLAHVGLVRAEEPIRVFFGPKAADDPTGLIHNLLKFLDSAKTSIHGSAHEVDMILVAEKLAERAAAGVEVHVVIEADWWESPKNKAARQVLAKSKVKVSPDTKKSGLMHNKFFIADGKRVWTGSTNLTQTCLLYNPNNAVWIDNDKVASNFESEFSDQAAGKFGKKGAGKNHTAHPIVRLDESTAVTTLFSPKDTTLKSIVDVVDAAKETIDIACFVFSSREVGEAVLAAHKRGVKVRVLLDNVFSSPAATASWKYVPFNELKRAGVSCKYDDEASKLHHKFVVVDRKVVITGSFNLSASAAADNDENLLIVESAAVAKQYSGEFERLWKLYHGDPGESPPPEKGDVGSAP